MIHISLKIINVSKVTISNRNHGPRCALTKVWELQQWHGSIPQSGLGIGSTLEQSSTLEAERERVLYGAGSLGRRDERGKDSKKAKK